MVSKKGIVVLLLFATTLIWSAGLSRPDGRTHFWTVVGKGQVSLVIRSDRGNFAVINPRAEALQLLGRLLPFYQRKIALVVVTDQKQLSNLDQFYNRYQVVEIWGNIGDQNVSKYSNFTSLSGQQSLTWEDLSFKAWSLPGQSSYINISRGSNTLAFAGSNKPGFWESIPDLAHTQVLIASSPVKWDWLAPPTYRQLHPQLVLAPGVSTAEFAVTSPSHREIVWESDSWYIDSNP